MYKKDKFFILMIHVSFIFLLIGAGLTRYVGYEGVMTIPEGSMQNQLLSNDEFLQVDIKRNDKTVSHYEKKVLMTPLSQTSIDEDLRLNSEYVHIKLNKFVPNAVEKIIPSDDGKAMINLIVTTFNGANSYDLKDEQAIQTKLLTFALNKPMDTKKPTVLFTSQKGEVHIQSNIEITFSTLQGEPLGKIKANESMPLKPNYFYSVAQTRFITPEFTTSGKLDVVSLPKEQIIKDKNVHALVLDILYRGTKQTIPLFGKGGSTQGFKHKLKLGDYEMQLAWGAKTMTLPFSILLNDFHLERYPGSNAPSTYSSDVKVYDKELQDTMNYKIYMNNTLDYRGYRFFQSSYKTDESATILSVNKDPGRVPTYLGYFLLFTGLILSLFSKKGRFQKLARKKYTIESVQQNFKATAFLFVALFLVTQNTSYAQSNHENISLEHANKLSSVLVQDYQGRIKPLNSLAIEITNKVSKTTSLFGLNENQIFLSMTLFPNKWQELKFIRLSHEKLKAMLNIPTSQKYFAFNDIYDVDGNYILTPYLEEANSKKASKRDTFDKEVIKVDERLNIAYTVFTGGFLKLFPKQIDNNNTWLSPQSFKTQLDEKSKEYQTVKNLSDQYFQALKSSVKTSQWQDANTKLNQIIDYQNEYAKEILPSEFRIKAELWMNKYNIFSNLTLYYLLLGLILLGFVFAQIFKPTLQLNKITKGVLFFLSIGFFLHTLGLGFRWYIADHAPWSNAYESMVYIAWAIILSGMYFAKASNLALATTSIFSGIILFVAHLSWLEPQVTTLTPVLKSYWLTIHVSVITASYGFLGLSALLGFITLILMIILNSKNHNERFFSILTSIKEARRINEMSILIGLVLLIIGNFLGGIWANESWGRYWGWDPKETWTLVSILIYAAIIHLHYVRGLSSNYVFATLTMVSYSAIIMTYFGVNYYLAGMHSYAAGDPIPIPTFVPVSAVVMFIVILFAYKNRKVC
jgi:cytochrome c-type biogenesis protein CcsB